LDNAGRSPRAFPRWAGGVRPRWARCRAGGIRRGPRPDRLPHDRRTRWTPRAGPSTMADYQNAGHVDQAALSAILDWLP